MEPQDRGLTSTIGPVEVDWPKTIGYYGGIGVALSMGMLEAPLAVFIGAIPFLKMLNRPDSPLPVRMVSQLMDGAAQPVGGDGDHSVRLKQNGRSSSAIGRLTDRLGDETGSIWTEAKIIARGKV